MSLGSKEGKKADCEPARPAEATEWRGRWRVCQRPEASEALILMHQRAVTVRRALWHPLSWEAFALRAVKTRPSGRRILMTRLRHGCVWSAPVAFSLALAGGNLDAQTTSTATTSTAATSSTATSMGMSGGMGMGMGGMGIMPMMSAMNPSASLSPTDAAALGMQGSGNGQGMNQMNGVFMNPMAAPYMLGYPMSTTQIGGMMMMNQMQNGGIGSGQISGVRPAAGQQRGRTKQQVPTKARGTTATPGGLAARYFNRTVSVNRPANVSRIPQNYYTRQNRYYPQVAR
jgi:hypothetical protein